MSEKGIITIFVTFRMLINHMMTVFRSSFSVFSQQQLRNLSCPTFPERGRDRVRGKEGVRERERERQGEGERE